MTGEQYVLAVMAGAFAAIGELSGCFADLYALPYKLARSLISG